MPGKLLPLWAIAAFLFAGAGGCGQAAKPVAQVAQGAPELTEGTIGQYATLLSRGQVAVQGYGVVMGLGTEGSTSIPPHLEEYFKQELLKQGLGSWQAGTQAISPARFLRDPDTAVVVLEGSFPVGAPEGSDFDVYARALPNTQTRSLAGGMLFPADMRLFVPGRSAPGGPTAVWARAAGPLFVNPFIDPAAPAEKAKHLEGRIIGGGTVLQSRPIRLRLREADRASCVIIERKINERFGAGALEKVARAINPLVIELTVPPAYRGDPEHFANLVLHLPLFTEGVQTRASEIAQEMLRPSAPHDRLAVIWEAMGRQVLPAAQGLYGSSNAQAAFYAARTGLRLGDETAGEVLARIAADSQAKLQVQAIEELGKSRVPAGTLQVLRTLLDDSNELVRVAAYEALARRGDRESITRLEIPGHVRLDLVDSAGGYAIYATQADQPRIVLFGKDMKVRKPLFFSTSDELVIINSHGDDSEMTLFRKVPRSGRNSDMVRCDFYVRSLAAALAGKPQISLDGRLGGLGLNYGQIVTVLYQMCKKGDIPARFVLQPPRDIQRIYQRYDSLGRPDMPGQ